jgi:hypothetical protein
VTKRQPADEEQQTDEKEPTSSEDGAPVSSVVDHPKALEAGVAGNEQPDDVLIVSWDGPDDVSNPKK